MIIDKSEIAAKLGKIKSAITTKSTIPALQGVLLKDGYLTAYNLEYGITAKLNIISDEQFIIPAKAVDMIDALPDGPIELYTDEESNLIIKTRSIKNRFATAAVADYPDIPSVSEGAPITIDSEQLTYAVSSVLYAVSVNPSRPALMGVYFEATDGALNFVGCDGYRIAWNKIKMDGSFSFIVPRESVQKMLSVGLTGDVEISFDTKRAIFRSAEYTVFTRLLEGNYLQYQKSIPDYKTTVIANRKDLLTCIHRAMICMDNRLKSKVKLEFADKEIGISLSTPSSDYAEAVKLETAYNGSLLIGFNAQFLHDALRYFDCENIEIGLGTDTGAMTLRDGDQMSMVLPVRLKAS
jgi:DNA polymerase III beta subunit